MRLGPARKSASMRRREVGRAVYAGLNLGGVVSANAGISAARIIRVRMSIVSILWG